jgi:hypothetical protein
MRPAMLPRQAGRSAPARLLSVMPCRSPGRPRCRRQRAAGGITRKAGINVDCPGWPVTWRAGRRESFRARPGASRRRGPSLRARILTMRSHPVPRSAGTTPSDRRTPAPLPMLAGAAGSLSAGPRIAGLHPADSAPAWHQDLRGAQFDNCRRAARRHQLGQGPQPGHRAGHDERRHGHRDQDRRPAPSADCRSHAGQSDWCGLRWLREPGDPRCYARSARTAAGGMAPFW